MNSERNEATTNTPVPQVHKQDMPDYYRIDSKGEIVPLTKGEYKKAMHDQWTVRGATIPACGHQFVPGSEPRQRNCDFCWFTFFRVHGELTQSCDEVFSKYGVDALRQIRGPKFVKNFLKFMSTLAQWKRQEENGKSIDGTGESNGNPTTGEDDWGGINPLGGGDIQS